MKIQDILTKINESELDSFFSDLYGKAPAALSKQKERYIRALKAFGNAFPEVTAKDTDVSVFSAPGRSEIGGNHTDHQKGRVLAAAVDLDMIAIVSGREDKVIRIQSEGYPMTEVDISDTESRESEKETTQALIRGVAAQFTAQGADVTGFDAYVTSNVLSGSGLSSSAAFEVLIGKIIDCRDNGGRAGAVEIAKYGQIAENKYFGKASGLMDQMASSVGNLVEIDFRDTNDPKIDSHQFNMEEAGFSLIITDTKGSHADLSSEYSSIPGEMRSVAGFFGKDYLSEIDENAFYSKLAELRSAPGISDRAILRSAHFLTENARVREEAQALDDGDIPKFLKLVNASGESSANLLQNLYSAKDPTSQAIPMALMLSRRVLGEEGACRVHGGGFAGTIQAFVPKAKVDEYVSTLEAVFGEGSCHILQIRPVGAVQLI
jgi:galactokinase